MTGSSLLRTRLVELSISAAAADTLAPGAEEAFHAVDTTNVLRIRLL